MYRKHNGNQRSGGFRGQRRNIKQTFFNPSAFISNTPIMAEVVEAPVLAHKFSDFLIADQIKRNIAEKGYENPTPIQDQAIPYILKGRDVIGIANTGTGKTGAFLIPLINKVLNNRSQKVLVIAPTRELAVQIQDELMIFGKNMGIYSVLCIGGVGQGMQIRDLRNNHDFVIGTPGRLMDLKKQGKLHLGLYNNVVLDEVDRMMDMGFINDVRTLISGTNMNRQSLFFSATVPPKLTPLIHSFLKNPVTVSVKSTESVSAIKQDVIRMNGRLKSDVLHDLLSTDGFDKVLVFGRTKWGMEKLSKALLARGFRVASIHGNKNQNQRQRALDQFKRNEIQVLLATDIASRGLDIEDVTHVINYDQPASMEDYIHRIGRTGRANKQGIALTFVD
jgi:ATP-dependent RNA helicase RhlE